MKIIIRRLIRQDKGGGARFYNHSSHLSSLWVKSAGFSPHLSRNGDSVAGSYNSSKGAGFSIIESLVAILIFSIALVPLFYVATSSLNVATNIKNNLIATNLVQEGLEVIRSIRDASWYQGDPAFNTDLPNGTWRVEWNSTALISLGSNPPIKIDSDGIYNYSTGTDTFFRRTVVIAEVNPGIELRIVSEVSWPDRNGVTMSGCPAGTRCINAESHLYNWQ